MSPIDDLGGVTAPGTESRAVTRVKNFLGVNQMVKQRAEQYLQHMLSLCTCVASQCNVKQ